ncbi:SatD family protein [Halorhabdus sp. BNX81]|uniref:SatD family protein n=1 Tax=Halorhabdus sp. BNX81 TaxID=2980181 RepID=UPI0023DD3F38|nr:SatD family protein [Halorhabdus sp. BNX81]WEL22100.1 hypothetical protein HBNXHr_2048 [Halorhabdus sp. BNX81]
MTTRRCVVIGDVIGSREVDDRTALRDRLETGLEAVNDALADRLVAPFATLKGVDEVGGVLESPEGAYRALQLLTEAIHPTTMRVAIVHGSVDIGANTGDVAEMDGPAFHTADDALGRLDERERLVALSFEEAHSWQVGLIEAQMELLSMWKEAWTPRQAEVVRTYRDAATMGAAAKRLGVSVQSVSKTLKRARAVTIIEIEETLETALSHLAEGTP